MSKAKKKAGRPFLLADSDAIYLSTANTKSKLQESSDRRAICNHLLVVGGKATVKDLNAAFGFDVRAIVLALAKVGWLAIENKSAV